MIFRVNVRPFPECQPLSFNSSAIRASVWSFRRRSTSATTSGFVCHVAQAGWGRSKFNVRTAPPLNRTWTVICSPLIRVTSSIKSRAIRLRSRSGVWGSFQSVGDQPVLGIDLEKPLPSQVGLVTGTLDMLPPQAIRLIQPLLQLLLDRQGDL